MPRSKVKAGLPKYFQHSPPGGLKIFLRGPQIYIKTLIISATKIKKKKGGGVTLNWPVKISHELVRARPDPEACTRNQHTTINPAAPQRGCRACRGVLPGPVKNLSKYIGPDNMF